MTVTPAKLTKEVVLIVLAGIADVFSLLTVRDKYTLEEWDKLGSAGRKIEIEIAKEAEKKKAKAEKKNEKAEKHGPRRRKRSRRPSRSCGRRKVKTRQLLSSSLRVKIVVQLARKDGTLGRCTTYGRFGSG